MLVARNENNKRNIASITSKSESPFFCPECNAEVVLKKGKVRIHHFAHKPPVNCIYGTGESQRHLKAKQQIYDALKNHRGCSKCQLERRLSGVRPDISLYINNTPVAIEVQKSVIDVDDIERRMKTYTKLGISVLWVMPYDKPALIFHKGESKYVHRIKEWEKYLHAMFFGRLYYWCGEATVTQYHLDPFKTWVTSSEWYSEDGEAMSAGGYYRTTKSLKIPRPNKSLHIAEDFKSMKRDKWKSRNWTIPSCKIWIDKFDGWW